MKKILFILVLVVATVQLFAYDIIVTKDAKSIKCTVTEVSKLQVKYKDAANPKGPIFILDVSDIETIIYDNGEVSKFENSHSNPVQHVNTSESSSQPLNDVFPRGNIYQRGDAFYINDTKIAENRLDLEVWMEKNYSKIYTDYNNFADRMQKMYKAGAGVTIIGGGTCALLGIIFLATNSIGSDEYTAGAAFMVIGSACVTVGTPLWIVGAVRTKNNDLVSYYNEHRPSYSKNSMRLEFQTSKDGIGLAYKF